MAGHGVSRTHSPAIPGARWILLGMLAAACAIALCFPVSLQLGDELSYIRAAQLLAGGRAPTETTFYGCRLGLVLPMALSFRLIGDGEAAWRLVPLVVYLGNAFVAYRLARRAISDAAGIAAALLALIYPAAYWQSTIPNTDAVFAFWVNLAFWAFLVAREREDRGAAFRGAFVAGLLAGAAYLTKEMGPVILVPWGVLAIRRRARFALGLGAASGLAAVFVLEAALSRIVWGSPLQRWTFLLPGGWAAETLPERIRESLAPLVDPFETGNLWVGMHFALAIAACVWALRRREGGPAPFAMWLALLFVAVAFGTTSFSSWSPLVEKMHPRFLAWVALPAHVLGGWAIARILFAWRTACRSIALATLAIFVAHSALLCAILRRDAGRDFAGLPQAIEWLGRRPSDTAIYTDWATARALTASRGLDAPVRGYQEVSEWRAAHGLILENIAVRHHPSVTKRWIDPASVGARIVRRFWNDPPWRLRSLLWPTDGGIEPVDTIAIWELPARIADGPRN